jgi:hypothetical protein
MGAFVFNNEIFDSWLNKKSDEILSKVNREMITTEEMIVLILKAQTNHFSHMDHDLKEAIYKTHDDMGKLESSLRADMEKMETGIRADMVKMETGIRADMIKMETGIRADMVKMETGIRADMVKMETSIRSDMDFRFNLVDKRFERVYTLLQWSMGITVTLFAGLYLKLFLG